MSAITGRYTPCHKLIDNMLLLWIRNRNRPRSLLSEQLREIRKRFSTNEAREFRNYLLWVGVYPSTRIPVDLR